MLSFSAPMLVQDGLKMSEVVVPADTFVVINC